MNLHQYLAVQSCITLAWEDTSAAHIKRSYTAASKALGKMYREYPPLKNQNKAMHRALKLLHKELIMDDLTNCKVLDIIENALHAVNKSTVK